MAKVTKKMLKGIVKECLVEILADGLGNSEKLMEATSQRTLQPTKKRSRSLFDQLDSALQNKSRAGGGTTFETKVSATAQAATDDPVLQGILADTARTTLQEQMQHESNIPTPHAISGGSSSHGHDLVNDANLPTAGNAGIDINSLFGEATKNWGEVVERTSKTSP